MIARALNFAPTPQEQEWMRKALQGSWDAGIDLAYRDILFDEERGAWVHIPEEDFDRRRSGKPEEVTL
jgi:hypothetical protein